MLFGYVLRDGGDELFGRVYPEVLFVPAVRGGSAIITAISNGTIAHKKNHHIGLRPFLPAITPPPLCQYR
jgi:hypothetical protein